MLDSSARTARVWTDRGAAYVKAMGNPKEGPHILACELVGTRAAEWLGLPTLDYGIMDLGESDVLAYSDSEAPSIGPAFVTRAIQAHTWGGDGGALVAVENPEAIAGLVVLDTWIVNRDRYCQRGNETIRNVRNVLLTGEGASRSRVRLIAMDHTHCFTYGQELRSAKLSRIDVVKARQVLGLFDEFRPFVSRQRIATFSRRLSTFDRATAIELTQGVPSAWGWDTDVAADVQNLLSEHARFLAEEIEVLLETTCGWDPVVG
ncbi:MAG: hypothetical protein QM784_28835 [Polyangiaceae bacterium]